MPRRSSPVMRRVRLSIRAVDDEIINKAEASIPVLSSHSR